MVDGILLSKIDWSAILRVEMGKISVVQGARLAEHTLQIVFTNEAIEMHCHFVTVQGSVDDRVTMLKQDGETKKYEKGIATSQHVW